jgi:hypothetical protein
MKRITFLIIFIYFFLLILSVHALVVLASPDKNYIQTLYSQAGIFESTDSRDFERSLMSDEKEESKQLQLISERTALQSSIIDETLHFYDSKSVVARIARVEINMEVKNDFTLRNGDQLMLNLFENTDYLSTVIDAYVNVNGTIVVTAKLDDFDFAYAIITTTGQRSLVNIFIPEQLKYYQIISDPLSLVHYIVEINSQDRDMLQNASPLIPSMIAPEDIQAQIRIKEELDNRSSGPNDPANIDVMIVYTAAAQTWANNSGGGIQNVIAQSMANALLVLNNSQTIMTVALVHSALVTYTESGNSGTDLQRFTNTNDGYMDEIHTWRNSYAADLCAIFSLANDTGGVGWLLTSPNGSPSIGFSLTRVQQAGWSYTHIHEMGHNMGLHHHKQQNFQAGPGLFSYSAGWRWQAASSWYNSVMAYSAGQYYDPPAPGAGINSTEVPYFSNPSVTHLGVPTGHSTNGDNARTLREIKHVIAAYRSCVLPLQPSAISGTINPCQGSTGNNYSVTNVSGVTYNWTFSGTGHTITSGQNSNSIVVSYSSNATSGIWTVTPVNACGSGTARTLSVILNALPSQPSVISGPTDPCQGSAGIIHSVTNVSGVTYNWTYSGSGHTITSGQNTNSIEVSYSSNATSGIWTVTPVNACGSGTVRTLSVILNSLPAQPSAIAGPANPCQGSAGNTYNVTDVSGVTYNWTFSGTGHTITSGLNTNSIVVSYSSNATSGIWTVIPINTCGSGITSAMAVELNNLPPQPDEISGPVSAFQGSSEHVYSVTEVSGVDYSWSYNGSGAVIVEGQGSSSITVSYSVSATSGSWTVIPGNICGNGPSASLSVSIIAVPMNIEVQNIVISDDQSICFSATQHITVAGNGTHFFVLSSGNVEFIAGESITFLPTTIVQSGGQLHAYISPNGNYCSLSKSLVNSNLVDDEDFFENQLFGKNDIFRIFPNPARSTFTLELYEVKTDVPVVVEIYTMRGVRLLNNELTVSDRHEFDLSAQPRGMYLIRLIRGDETGIEKLILE